MSKTIKPVFFSGDIQELAVDLLALATFEDQVSDVRELDLLDSAFGGRLRKVLEEEEFSGKKGQRVLLHTQDLIAAHRVLIVGLGKREDFDVPKTRYFGAAVMDAATQTRIVSLGVVLPPLDTSAAERSSRFLTEGLSLAAYRFDRYRAEDSRKRPKVDAITIVLAPDQPEPHLALAQAKIVAEAVNRARDLVNEPASELTPQALADYAQELAKGEDLDCTILEAKACEKRKMGLFLAVARGSATEPRFLHLVYRPKGKTAGRRIALVGKGVTFDSGGLSLKSNANMLDMKCDMAGAAVVLAVMGALSDLGVKAEVHGVVAATENMISATSYKLGDIIKGMGGKTVEIHNTDAEGRLTLADALSYVVKEVQPDEIIDLATLTGACVVALGPHHAGVMGNDNALTEHFLAASRRAGEHSWKLPLPHELRSQLDSKVADLKNTGDRWGGALTAGLFLQEFVEEVPWLHIDIAGPAFAEKADGHIPQGGTGYGVASVLEHLLSWSPKR
ncbi:MAG: leucyl aminopeptidase [Deltaproteobacteria bacterium]|nr:leucyl aminopeptidase [Deltaproteobacteria bacterium]